VLDALCDVYSRAMGCLRRLLAPLLPELLDQLGASFSRTPVVGCLSCITQVLIHTAQSHWPIQDILSLVFVCARINHSFIILTPPISIAHTTAILLRDFCAPTLSLYATIQG